MKINILEGQTGKIKIQPTFEGKPVLPSVEIDESLTDLKGMVVLSKEMVPIDKANAYLVLTALASSKGTGKIVFRYMGRPSNKENVGMSTKTVNIVISPAVLNVVNVKPSVIKWIPGQETDIAISWANGLEPVLANNPLLDLTAAGDNFTIVSRSETGVRIKINSKAAAGTLPTKEQSINAKYYSGTAKAVLSYRLKPNLVITPLTVNLKGKGSTTGFPFKVMDGTKDVTKELTNIKASDGYLKINDDGSMVVLKVDLLAIVRTVTYTFDYVVDGLVWSYATKVNVTIGNLINL